MILAVIPVVLPILALLGVGGGLFAWLKFRKPKADGTDTPPVIGPAGGGDKPAVEGTKPTLTMSGVGTTAVLERKGESWTYKVTGREPATGGNADAGAAAVEMAQAFAASDPSGPLITGSATSATNPPLNFGIEQNQDLWEWSITSAMPIPSPVPGVPAAPKMVADGYEERRSTAILKVLSALADELDWLAVPAFEGGAAPQPEPEGEPPPGIKVSGKNLGVTNLAAWIAYAAPLVREHLTTGSTADEIMDDLLGRNLPDNTRIQGQRIDGIGGIRARLQRVLDSIKDGTYLDSPSPDAKVAAAIVGSDYKLPDAWVAKYKDHVILVSRSSRRADGSDGAGGLAPNVETFRYTIWAGDMRGYDADAATSLVTDGLTRNKTIKAARDRIDAALGEEPDNAGGWDPVEDVDPLVAVNASLVPPKPIDYSARKKLTITAPSWRLRQTKDVEIFDFAAGDLAERRDWTLGVAVCITSDVKLPFGSLSSQLVGQGPEGMGFADPFGRFLIRQADGDPITDWDGFRRPLAFKTQLLGKFERVAGKRQAARITKPLGDISGTAAGNEYDPCKDTEFRWPTTDGDGFLVQPAAEQFYKPWDPTPSFKLVPAGGTKLVLRITFAGFPLFADAEGGQSPALVVPTKLKLDVKVWASGINL